MFDPRNTTGSASFGISRIGIENGRITKLNLIKIYNSFQKIEHLARLTGLTSLYLSENDLEELPEQVYELPNLEHLLNSYKILNSGFVKFPIGNSSP